jgi:hypothetical protein
MVTSSRFENGLTSAQRLCVSAPHRVHKPAHSQVHARSIVMVDPMYVEDYVDPLPLTHGHCFVWKYFWKNFESGGG